MNDKIKLTLALIALAGAGGYLAYFYKSQPKPGATVVHTQPLCCTACGKGFIADVGDPPVECKFCGQPTAWGAAFCLKCKKAVPIVDHKCAHCQGQSYREASPNEVEALSK